MKENTKKTKSIISVFRDTFQKQVRKIVNNIERILRGFVIDIIASPLAMFLEGVPKNILLLLQ